MRIAATDTYPLRSAAFFFFFSFAESDASSLFFFSPLLSAAFWLSSRSRSDFLEALIACTQGSLNTGENRRSCVPEEPAVPCATSCRRT